MHVALFIRSLTGSGAERSIANLANGLAGRGLKVDLLLAQAKGPFLSELSPSVRIVDLKGGAVPAAVRALTATPGDLWHLLPVLLGPGTPRVLRSISQLSRYLRTERPEILISALDYGNIAAICAAGLSGTGIPVIISLRNQFSHRIRDTQKWRERFLAPLVRRFYPRANGIIAVSNGVADDLSAAIAIPRHRITTIYNPVVTAELLKRADEQVRHEWFGPGQPPVILGVGRLKPQKDFTTLLRAFAKVRRARHARLIILGEGPQRYRLEALARELAIAEDVDLPGFVENPFAYMAKAALFVLSSTYEGLPGALIQAMACGCPVVSTNCPSGPAEILENGAHGPLLPVGDPDALADAMLATLARPPAKDRLYGRASHFTIDAATERVLAVINDVLRFRDDTANLMGSLNDSPKSRHVG